MEIGWYLRFSRGDTFEALIDPGTLGQAEHALHVLPEWSLATEDRGDHLLVRFARKTD